MRAEIVVRYLPCAPKFTIELYTPQGAEDGFRNDLRAWWAGGDNEGALSTGLDEYLRIISPFYHCLFNFVYLFPRSDPGLPGRLGTPSSQGTPQPLRTLHEPGTLPSRRLHVLPLTQDAHQQPVWCVPFLHRRRLVGVLIERMNLLSTSTPSRNLTWCIGLCQRLPSDLFIGWVMEEWLPDFAALAEHCFSWGVCFIYEPV